jgi:hypothetical protein
MYHFFNENITYKSIIKHLKHKFIILKDNYNKMLEKLYVLWQKGIGSYYFNIERYL